MSNLSGGASSRSNIPLVSVLTPSLNHGAFLSECLRSVREQTYARVEHVVVDGGSTDNSLSLLANEGGVRWETGQDRGQAHALNLALQKSKGEFIGVLNADDVYAPEAIAEAVRVLQRHPEVAVVYGDQYNISAGGEVLNLYSPGSWTFEEMYCVELVIPAQAAFFRRESLERVGFFVDETLTTCPDYELWVRLGLRFPMLYVPKVWAKYRVHEDSESAQSDMVEEMMRARRAVFDKMEALPEFTERLTRLRARAEFGVLLWGAVAQLNCKRPLRALPLLLRATACSQDARQRRLLLAAFRRFLRG